MKNYKLYDGDIYIGTFKVLGTDNVEVDLIPNLNLFNVPCDFWKGYKSGRTKFTGKEARNFVTDRVIPSYRHGINLYLKHIGLKEYDPLEIFLHNHGRYTQDSFRIE